jgi:hypothetical protein
LSGGNKPLVAEKLPRVEELLIAALGLEGGRRSRKDKPSGERQIMFSFKRFEKRQAIAVLFLIGSCLAALLVTLYIRPYFFHHNIKDFGVTGSLPNFFFTLGLSPFPLLLGRSFPFKKFRPYCIYVVCGAIGAEFSQLFSGGGVFDPLDLVASVVGAVVAFYFCKRFVFSKEEIL